MSVVINLFFLIFIQELKFYLFVLCLEDDILCPLYIFANILEKLPHGTLGRLVCDIKNNVSKLIKAGDPIIGHHIIFNRQERSKRLADHIISHHKSFVYQIFSKHKLACMNVSQKPFSYKCKWLPLETKKEDCFCHKLKKKLIRKAWACNYCFIPNYGHVNNELYIL